MRPVEILNLLLLHKVSKGWTPHRSVIVQIVHKLCCLVWLWCHHTLCVVGEVERSGEERAALRGESLQLSNQWEISIQCTSIYIYYHEHLLVWVQGWFIENSVKIINCSLMEINEIYPRLLNKGSFCQTFINVRSSWTSHGRGIQTSPVSLNLNYMPKITLKLIERMKFDRVSLFSVVENI